MTDTSFICCLAHVGALSYVRGVDQFQLIFVQDELVQYFNLLAYYLDQKH